MLNNPPIVSIILPTYNRANLLPGAIESVLAQTYSTWELIVWDDGSEDNTKETVLSFQDNRIKYHFAPNHGKSYALNQSINYAQGELIAFIDDDDQWMPKKLSLQVDILKNNENVDLLFGNFININKAKQTQDLAFDQNAKGLEQLKTKRLGDGTYIIMDGWFQGITRENFIAFDTVIIHKNVINHIGQFTEHLKNGEDFEYWWRFGLAGLHTAYTEKVLLKRIKYPGSLSGRSLKSIENHLKMLDTCTNLSIKYGRPETIKYLKPMYRNAWQNMIVAFGNTGDKKGVWHAFSRSLDYGFRLGSVKLLIQALSKDSIPLAKI